MTPSEDTLRRVLGSNTNDKSVHAQAIWEIIRAESTLEKRIDLLVIALLERDTVKKQPEALQNLGLPDAEWEQLVKSHAEMINGHLKMAFFRTKSAKDFASAILKLVEFYQDESEKIFVLGKAIFSPYVPYQQLPGSPVQMKDSEYKQKLESIPQQVTTMDYIMDLPFDQRTETASMVLQVLDSIQEKGVRVALLAHVLFQLETGILKQFLRRTNTD